ncbi:MAG: O-antigen ligase family protein [Casimicrobiaceae bacterium]
MKPVRMRPRAEFRVPQAPARSAVLRARIFALLRFSLLSWACIYFALVAISGHTYFRSIAFGFASIFALWLILGALFSDGEPIPVPDWYLWSAIVAWSGWSVASLAWSLHPAYTKLELGTEVGWGLATVGIFYVAARTGMAFRAMLVVAVASAAFLSVLAVIAAVAAGNFDPEHALLRSHGGAGAFSTYLVLVIPLLPLLLAPRPAGFGAGPWPLALTAAVFVLLLAAARLTENRMIWVAVAAGFVVAASLAAWRWRARLQRAPRRWGGVLLALLLLIGALFADAAFQRARTDFKPDTPVAQSFADDPRFALWQHSFERIRERPWTGFGYGKSILAEELRGELHDPLLAHAHNLFVSQWLQTGAIGVLTLLALLAALAWSYGTFMRAPDGTLAAIGLAGLVMLVTFIVKNLTDDFMIRPTSKEFWALNALLIGYGIRLRAQIAGARFAGPTI